MVQFFGHSVHIVGIGKLNLFYPSSPLPFRLSLLSPFPFSLLSDRLFLAAANARAIPVFPGVGGQLNAFVGVYGRD